MCVGGLVLLVPTWSVPTGPALSGPVATLAFILANASFGVVGALIVWNRPANLIGWLCLAVAIVGHDVTFGRYLAYTLVVEPDTSLPSLEALASFAAQFWLVPTTCFVLLLIVFPTGRPGSRAMAVVACALPAVVIGAIATGAVDPGRLPEPLERRENALGIDGFELAAALNLTFLLGFALFAAVGAADMLRRFLRSTGEERQQFKWFVYAAAGVPALMLASFVLAVFAPGAVDERPLELAASFLLAAVPVAIGVAVLKYRLYDIDLLIRRTLVYGLLTVGLGATYAVLVLAGQAFFSPLAGGSDLAIAVSTLVVAALFLPLRGRVQRFVDRRFYRRRYDAQRTIERSPPGSARRSTSTRCVASCSWWSTRRCSRCGPTCG